MTKLVDEIINQILTEKPDANNKETKEALEDRFNFAAKMVTACMPPKSPVAATLIEKQNFYAYLSVAMGLNFAQRFPHDPSKPPEKSSFVGAALHFAYSFTPASVEEVAKYNAWNAIKDMAPMEAMKKYIEIVKAVTVRQKQVVHDMLLKSALDLPCQIFKAGKFQPAPKKGTTSVNPKEASEAHNTKEPVAAGATAAAVNPVTETLRDLIKKIPTISAALVAAEAEAVATKAAEATETDKNKFSFDF